MSQPPVVVWQRAGFRIVAVDKPASEDEDGDYLPAVQMLCLEQVEKDLVGVDAWDRVLGDDHGTFHALDLLMTEIVSRIDVAPKWVRDFVKKDTENFDKWDKDEKKDNAS